MESVLLKTTGFILAGFWAGWALLILADDVTIRRNTRWRKGRALLLAVLMIFFLALLALRDFRQFGVFVSAMTLGVVVLRPKR